MRSCVASACKKMPDALFLCFTNSHAQPKKPRAKTRIAFFYHAAPFFAYICKVKNERPPINNNSFAINYVVNKNLLFKIYIIYE